MFSDDDIFGILFVTMCIAGLLCGIILALSVGGWSDPVAPTISIKDKMHTYEGNIIIDSNERIYVANDIITYSNLMVGKSYIVNVSSNIFRKEYRIDGIVREV